MAEVVRMIRDLGLTVGSADLSTMSLTVYIPPPKY